MQTSSPKSCYARLLIILTLYALESPTIPLYTGEIPKTHMARYERSRGKGPKDRFSKKETKSAGSYEEYTKSKKGTKRESGRYDRKRPELEMTKVTCSSCGEECEVPFKPTSSKPVYCRNCFEKKEKPSKSSNKDLEIINKKLDKIIKALDI
mgnify:FL=1